ncbi:hypothetical protein LJR246_005431 [Mesorhizobium sp. LjRoot246]
MIFVGVGRHNRRRSVRRPIIHDDYIQYLVGLPADAGKRCADVLLGMNIGTTPPCGSIILDHRAFVFFGKSRRMSEPDNGIGWQHCPVKIGANWRQAKKTRRQA